MLLDLDEIYALKDRFAKTHPTFQATITRIAEQSPKLQPLGVFSLWRAYSQECDAADQSPVMFEFLQWYSKQLGIEGRIHEVLEHAERDSNA